jgi:hypothetical protein
MFLRLEISTVWAFPGFGQLQKLKFALNFSIFSSKELVKEVILNQIKHPVMYNY